MKEKDFQTQFKARNTYAGIFELKICKGTSIPFAAVADHQREALDAVSGDRGLYHKITDIPVSTSNMRFTKKKPFDCFFLKNVPAYVVIMFYTPRKRKNVYYIKAHRWEVMQRTAERKSATEEMCKEYAEYIVDYLRTK